MQNAQLSNNVGTQESHGRRWVRRAGDAAVRQRYAPKAYVAMAVLCGIFGVRWGIGLDDALVAVLAAGFGVIVWLTAALLWYERKNFYEIILEQEQRIAELEQSLQHTR